MTEKTIMFKQGLLALVVAGGLSSQAFANTHPTIDFKVDSKNPEALQQLIPAQAKLEVLEDNAKWSEGPLVLQDNSVIWSDIVNNRVLKWNEKEGTTTWLYPAQFHNGHAMDKQGRILAASHGKRAIERQEADGSWHVLVDLYKDKKLNSPNDLIIDKEGEIWFTDPTFGILKKEEGYGGNPVAGGEFSYRYNPETQKIIRLNTPEVKTPNGIALSPDQKTLYIADSQLGHNPDDKTLRHHLVAYDIDNAKNLSNGRDLANISTGVPDGIAVDEKGNIWVTGGEYIHIFTPSGKEIGSIKFPTVVANIVFSQLPNNKKVAYVTGSNALYRLDVAIQGTK